MQRLLVAIGAFALMITGALAQPAPSSSGSISFMLGIAADFGDANSDPTVGITAKVLSTNAPNNFVVGGGVTFFPWAEGDNLGLDLSVGYLMPNFVFLGGYDLLRQQLQVSGGWVPTLEEPEVCLDCLSDARLKHDIHLLRMGDDGIRLYSFKYLWSDETYVGVMAQDLLTDPKRMQAVKLYADGYYRVDYRSLGLRMTTLADWKLRGLAAVTIN